MTPGSYLRDQLIENGPMIAVIVRAGKKERSYLALVDTGSNRTVIRADVIRDLGLLVVDSGNVDSANFTGNVLVYEVDLLLRDLKAEFPQLQVGGMHLPGAEFAVILGRDVLAHCTFTYRGRDGSFVLDFSG